MTRADTGANVTALQARRSSGVSEYDLIQKYRNERAGFAPWRFINTLSEDEIRADLRSALAMPGGVCEVIAGWLGQALRARPYLLEVPAGW
jgi:hypothetical protein